MPYPGASTTYGPGGQQYGPELVRNGDFASDSGDWFVQSGAIAGGELSVSDPVAFRVIATQSNVVQIGKTYLLELTISAYGGGSIGLNCGQSSGAQGTRHSAVGTYAEELVAAGSLPSIVLQTGNVGFTGSIDRVSVREILN